MTLETIFIIICILNIIYIILMNYIALKVMHALDVQPALLPSGQFRQIKEYRALLEKEGKHPWFMFYLKNAKLVLCFYVVLWSSLIIIFLIHWLKLTQPCPFCNAVIHKRTNLIWEHFKLIFFAMLWIGLVLFLMAIVIARQIGLKTSLIVCFWYWAVVVVVFFTIIFLNLAIIFILKFYRTVNKR